MRFWDIAEHPISDVDAIWQFLYHASSKVMRPLIVQSRKSIRDSELKVPKQESSRFEFPFHCSHLH